MSIHVHPWLKLFLALFLALPLSGLSNTISQTVNSAGSTTAWNDAVWGTPAAVPAGTNDYVTAPGFFAANDTFLGLAITGRMRAYPASATFGGASLAIVAGTELLLKDAVSGADSGNFTANIILDGGVLRQSGNNTGDSGIINGTIHLTADSIVGAVGSGQSLTIASALTGTNTLRIAGGQSPLGVIFDDGAGTSLDGFTGTFNIGGGATPVTVNFNQNYSLPAVKLRMGNYGTADSLNLSRGLTFHSFSFGGNGLAPGTYSAAQLNALFGTGNQFLDNGGSLTVQEGPVTNSSPAARVFLVGDSTVATYASNDPKRGWGQEIHRYFESDVTFVNNAVPGASTKTFIGNGYWAQTMAQLITNSYVLIQFGHNDSHNPVNPESTDATGNFRTYLQQYINNARSKGAIPVLVTPMHRRNFDASGTLLSYYVDGTGHTNDLAPYAEAMRQVAQSNNVPLVDLFASSGALLQSIGPSSSIPMFAPGDITHFNEAGAKVMAALVARGISSAFPAPGIPADPMELTQYLRLNLSELNSVAADSPVVGGIPQATNDFHLVQAGTAATIVYDSADAKVVEIASGLFAEDIQRVTGVLPVVTNTIAGVSGRIVLIGTVGHSSNLDSLIADGKMDVSAIQGGWERYQIQVVENPFPGILRALVIAGSNRRGTAYGAFSLSEATGVSPWYWWADVTPRVMPEIYVSAVPYVSGEPGVRYRGIFINDEDWGLQEWAEKTFESGPGEVKDIGPKTYAKVFELLLRLKANYIWPAMHPSTRAFNTYADNKVVADNYAIVMGSSHAEPMLRNNVYEWYNDIDPVTGQHYSNGSWNYSINQTGVYRYWDQRAIANGQYENVYTLGKRGIHDSGMVEGANNTQKAAWLNTIIADQRGILTNRVHPDATQVPQIFVPYKEVLNIYETGLVNVPDDVTFVWPDDNHGYIRQLSSAAERARGGGSGIYYHISYWGSPANYLWLFTTPPGLVCSEMMKAWDYEARRLWVVNVGDIKPGEIGMEFFLRLARDPEAFRDFDPHAYLAQWAARNFGGANAEAIATLLGEYYRLNIMVRPEHLNRTSSGFNFVGNGDEAQQRLDEFAVLTAGADALYAQLPASQKAAFYEMILYPIRGADLLNRKVLLAERSRLWAAQGRAATASLAAEAQAAHNAILSETSFYNQVNADGKWNHMITVTTSGAANAPFLMPTLGSYTPPAAAGLGVAVEGFAAVLGVNAGALPTFNPVASKSYFIDVFNTGTGAISWTAQSSEPWLILSQTNGTTDARIWVAVDWANAPRGFAVPGTITIQGAGATNIVNAQAFYPLSLNVTTLPPAVENNGVVTFEAEDYTSRQDGPTGVGWRRIQRATASRDGMTIQPVTAAAIDPAAISSNTPSLTYQFHAFSAGAVTVQTHCLPTHKITSDHAGCRYAISLNGDAPQIVDIHADEFTSVWSVNVLRAAAHGLSSHTIANAGLQTLKVWMIDPGVVLDKFTITISRGSNLEAENLERTGTPGVVLRTFTEGIASGGAAVALESVSSGQFVTLGFTNVPAGKYDLTVRVKKGNNRGRVQMSLGDSGSGNFTNVGGEVDLYDPSQVYTDLAPVRVTIAPTPTNYLKFTVTGRNASSSASWVVVDSLAFGPVLEMDGHSPLQNWRMIYFGTIENTGDAADNADADQDGIHNLIEFVTGSYPTVSNGLWFTAAITNDHLSVSFNRARDATDATLRVVAEDSLPALLAGGTEIWSSGAVPYPGVAAPITSVTVVDPQSTEESASRFIRLQASRP